MNGIFRLTLRSQVTRGRAAGLGVVALLGLLLALGVRNADVFDRRDAAGDLVVNYCISLLVPVVALVFAAAALGDPAEDRTLVYLWLRPVARWRIAVASWAASACTSLAFGAVPTALVGLLASGEGKLAAAAFLGAAVAVAGYTTLFLLLGLVVRRALVWGLAYLLIWEQFVARSGTTAARLSNLIYARSLFADLADLDPPRLAASTGTSVVTPLVVGAIALAVTSYTLRRLDVA